LSDDQLVVARLGWLYLSSRKRVLPGKIAKAVNARFHMTGLYSVVRFFSMDCPVNGVHGQPHHARANKGDCHTDCNSDDGSCHLARRIVRKHDPKE
jgi:hypothetical protein